MSKHMILYRGSLKSCNYRCSYCPFSKHPASERELAKDREEWLSFVENYKKNAAAAGAGALMAAPYGEALIHPWYWEGLAAVSAMAETDAAGAQTNLSFPIEKCLGEFVRAGGRVEKLRLWATFHPEMTTVSVFAARCRQLWAAGVRLCAGSVGVPEHLELLRQLREELPEDIYLWVNKMDGLKRPYTEEETAAFWEIDPYFIRELTPVPADAARCRGRLFVEGSGRLHACNISQMLKVEQGKEIYFPEPKCSRKFCSCYLAYGGREEFMNHIMFGEYPLFRIPRRPKAVFFDIEGTLLLEEKGADTENAKTGRIRPADRAGLEALAKDGVMLFFATTLPFEKAMRRCGGIRHLFSGGIFSGGAHLRLEDAGTVKKYTPKRKSVLTYGGQLREAFLFFSLRREEHLLAYVAALRREYCFRVLAYRKEERLYKITLFRPGRRSWSKEEAEEIFRNMPARGETRYYIEKNCLQIVAAEADKAGGVRRLCEWLNISPKEAAAAGNSEEDRGMMELLQIEQEFLI